MNCERFVVQKRIASGCGCHRETEGREESAMSKGYVAANGQEITEEMIARWCEAYERGEFPEGERSSGQVMLGCPPLSTEGPLSSQSRLPSG